MTAHYLMIGGFLGAGKTTALLAAGRRLSGSGRRVGLITNDQSDSLVDTALARAKDLPVEEIAGGCFCCRFNSLVDAAARLTESTRPDVFLAEPVGSCTDLAATVSLPLRHLYADRYRVAPLSVLIDPDRALRVLGLEAGRAFSPKVQYVYVKQLEEADVLVINKIDAVTPERRAVLRDALSSRFPVARIVEISARTGAGVPEWIESLLDEEPAGRVLDIDYDTYADGEALLGWLNATARIEAGGVEGDDLILDITRAIHARLAAGEVEIAHLKLTLVPEDGQGIAVVNATRTESSPELAFALDGPVAEAVLTINLRAEAAPEVIEDAVRAVLRDRRPGVAIHLEHLERFRPGRPQPTHRMAAL